MPRTIKELLAADELVTVFAVGRVPHSIVIEMFGLAGGYKGFWIDDEHTAVTINDVQSLAIAGRANDFDCFVRMSPIGYWHVTQCLEAGAGGVMAAQIHSADHAREFTSWCKYLPQGVRGLNMGGRDGNYSYRDVKTFPEEANRENFVSIQIETLGALQQADEIASIEGVDQLFVGPADLSLCLGVVGQFHHEKLWEAIGQVDKACKNHGKTWGCVAPDPKFADRAVELGCRMPTIGNDLLVLRRGIEKFRESFPNQFG